MTTGSIPATTTNGVAPSDWEVVRQTIAADPDYRTAQTQAWQNPRTGSYGTVKADAGAQGSGGICRSFSTTVNDLRGARLYRGEACRPQGYDWQLNDIVADDDALL